MIASDEAHARIRRRALSTASTVALLHLVFRAVLIFGTGFGGPTGFDERAFHMPVIVSFVEQWPNPDVSDYAAASTPGHHLVAALLIVLFDPAIEMIRFVTGTPITLSVFLLAYFCAARAGPVFGIIATLPFACSPHTVSFSVFVVPEASAWGVLTLLLFISFRDRYSFNMLAIASVVLFACVLTRQINLWGAAVIWLAAWLGSGDDQPASRLAPAIDGDTSKRAARAAIAIVATLPSFAIVAWFFSKWGGPTPEAFQSEQNTGLVTSAVRVVGPNPAIPALILALTGVVGVAFLPIAFNRLREAQRQVAWFRHAVFIGATLGALTAIVFESSSSHEAGRWGGLWNAVARVPDIADRSPLMIAGAATGGACAAILLVLAPGRRTRWLMLGAFIAGITAQSANAQAFQRYMEPLVLLLVPMAVACGLRAAKRPYAPLALVGPLVLALLQLVQTVMRINDPV